MEHHEAIIEQVASFKVGTENLWELRDNISYLKEKKNINLITKVIELLDQGLISVVEVVDNQWIVNEWIKKSILLFFKIKDSSIMTIPSFALNNYINWFDKVDLKFSEWTEEQFKAARIRAVPGSFVRKGAYIAPNVVLMPSFVNIGAYIGENTMVDTWATVGSCARVGKNCHISGGAGIGGVLEPIQSLPVIIEDNCFIGARSEVAEGVIIREGSVLSMGVYISASTRIIDRVTGEVYYGEVPPYSVVVPGSSMRDEGLSLYCAVIVKKVDDKTLKKTSINDILREVF